MMRHKLEHLYVWNLLKLNEDGLTSRKEDIWSQEVQIIKAESTIFKVSSDFSPRLPHTSTPVSTKDIF